MNDDAERFVCGFREFWSAPDPARLDGVLHDDVVLYQPLAPPARGLAAAKRSFERIFAAIPDLRATVDRSAASEETVFIEFRLHGTIGSRRVEWPVVDRFTLRGERAVERMTWFDPLPLLGAVLRHPSSWLRFAPILRGR